MKGAAPGEEMLAFDSIVLAYWYIVRPELPDAALLDLCRTGDDRAFAELWTRHASAATRLARQFRGNWDAEDLVAEAYTRVLDLVRRGRGPHDAFRPYLFAVVRNIAQAWSKRVADLIDDFDALPDPETEHDPAVRSLESHLTRRAFEALPERQRAVLWYTEVEGMTPQQISPAGHDPQQRLRAGVPGPRGTAHRVDPGSPASRCLFRRVRVDPEPFWATPPGPPHRQKPRAGRGSPRQLLVVQCSRVELRDVGSALAIAILVPVVGLGAGLGYLGSAGAAPAAAGTLSASAAAGAGALATPAGIGAITAGVLGTATVLAIVSAVVVSSAAPPSVSEAAETATGTTVLQPETTYQPAPAVTPAPVDPADPALPTLPVAPSEPQPAPAPEPSGDAVPVPDPAPEPVSPQLPASPAAPTVRPLSASGERPTFSGTGEPGGTVTLKHPDGSPIATAPVQPDGTWSMGPQSAITTAAEGFRVSQTDSSGAVSDDVVLGPYDFRLTASYPTEPQPCGSALYGVHGWESTLIGVRLDTPTDTEYAEVHTDSGGYRNATSIREAPWRLTFSYVDNPDAPAVVFTGCGWPQ